MFPAWFCETLEQFADISCVIGRRDDRAPTGAGAGCVAMNVGNGIAVGKLQRGVLFEERDHLWAGLKERVDHRRIVTFAQFVFQVSARLLNVFDDAGTPRQGLHGTQAQPPDQAVAPPNTGSFSTTMTFSPCHAAVTAAEIRPHRSRRSARRSQCREESAARQTLSELQVCCFGI
jgi:hypothetical protein